MSEMRPLESLMSAGKNAAERRADRALRRRVGRSVAGIVVLWLVASVAFSLFIWFVFSDASPFR